jgi:EasF-like predicted methyltransferase
MLAVQPITNGALVHPSGHQEPYHVPPATRKDASQPSAPRTTEHYDIIDIRKGGISMNLSESIRASLQTSTNNCPRSLPSLLLWDEQGLKLFEKITYNPQYYLTNAEIDILETHSKTIAEQIEPGTLLLELGSGALRKTEILLRAIEAQGKDVDYYALDLDRNELARTLKQLGPTSYRHVRCHGLLGTYDDGRAWLSKAENADRSKAVLSLGSTIGGLTRVETTEFLREWSSTLQSSGTKSRSQVIIGLDGNTDGATVWNAYNDFAGDNRRFVMNALSHANHDLGCEAFRLSEWTVEGVWDAVDKCHNQYVVPLKDVILEGTFLRKGERILVCQSYKWDHVERKRLWQRSNLAEKAQLCANGNDLYGMFPLPLIVDGFQVQPAE